MRRDDVIAGIRARESAIRSLGVSALYLYGSHARDEAAPSSDIDVFIDRDPKKPFGFLEYTGVIHLLEDTFGTAADVSTRASLHPDLRQEIESSAVRIF
jgi:uncharacterized protein